MTIYERREDIRINEQLSFNYIEIDNNALEKIKKVINRSDEDVLASGMFPSLSASQNQERINISISGMGFNSPSHIGNDSSIAITIKINNEDPIFIAATVVESEKNDCDKYYIHVHFTYISNKNRKKLNEFIKNKLSE